LLNFIQSIVQALEYQQRWL